MSQRAGQPTLSDAAGAGDDEVAPGPDPVAGGELEEQRAVEATMAAVVDILDAGRVAQAGGPCAGLEALLPAGGAGDRGWDE